MSISKAVLVRALTNYQGYLPTASNALRDSRLAKIPCNVAGSEDDVLRVASGILEGTLSYGCDSKDYEGMPENLRLAVALVLAEAWSETLEGMRLEGLPPAVHGHTRCWIITQRVFEFLAYIPVEHAYLAIRNWGSGRDGGEVQPMRLICDMKLTSVPVFMRVYQGIRRAWDQKGYDYDRRTREEQESRDTHLV